MEISGWRVHDPTKNIWKVKVPAGTAFSHFWIEGKRATRAWSGWNPKGFTAAPAGLRVRREERGIARWKNPRDLFVLKRSGWYQAYCPVTGITESRIFTDPASEKTLEVPASAKPVINWTGLFFLNRVLKRFKTEFALENAYELLSDPGEWYLDQPDSTLYYIPLSDGFSEKTPGTYPVGRTLIKLDGSLENPVSNIEIRGMTFCYTGGSKTGITAGVPTEPTHGTTPLPPESCLQVNAGNSITIRSNLFVHIGADALHFDLGGQGVEVCGNGFGDISRSAISLSQTNLTPCDGTEKTVHPENLTKFFDGVDVRNNYIRDVAMDDACQAITFTEFTRNIRFVHNEFRNIPKAAIRNSWRYFGWRGHTGGIEYAWNRVSNACTRALFDFSALYISCSNAGESSIHHNFVDGVSGFNFAIYIDVFAENVSIHNNVIRSAHGWLNFMASSGNHAFDNWTDTRRKVDASLPTFRFWPANRVRNNHFVSRRKNGPWPDGAKNIMEQSGLEENFSPLRQMVDKECP
ncbi:MAG: hypothetical protein ABIM40_01165 [Pseudomonadota bacterium]